MRYPNYLNEFADKLMKMGGLAAVKDLPHPWVESLFGPRAPEGSPAYERQRSYIMAILRTAYQQGEVNGELCGYGSRRAAPKRRRQRPRVSAYLATLAQLLSLEMQSLRETFRMRLSPAQPVLVTLPNNVGSVPREGYSQYGYAREAEQFDLALAAPMRNAAWAAQDTLSQLPVATYAAILFGHLVEAAEQERLSKDAHRRALLACAAVALSVALSRCLNFRMPGLAGVLFARHLLQAEVSRPLSTGLSPLPLRTFLASRITSFVMAERFFFAAAVREVLEAASLDGTMENYREIAPYLPPVDRKVIPAFVLSERFAEQLDFAFPPLLVDGDAQRRWLREHFDVPLLPTVERIERPHITLKFMPWADGLFCNTMVWERAPRPMPWERKGARWLKDGMTVDMDTLTREMLNWPAQLTACHAPTDDAVVHTLQTDWTMWRNKMQALTSRARAQAEDEEFEARLSTIRAMSNRDIRREMFRQLWEELHAKGKLERYRGRLDAFFDAVIGDEFSPDPLLEGRDTRWRSGAATVSRSSAERDIGVTEQRPVSPVEEQPVSSVNEQPVLPVEEQPVELADTTDDEAELQRLIARFQQGPLGRPVGLAGEERYSDVTVERSVEPVDDMPEIAPGLPDDIRAGLRRAIEEGRKAARELQEEAKQAGAAGGESAAGGAGVMPGLPPMPEWLRQR